MRRIYLDHTATTPLDPTVVESMRPYFSEKFGNASSIHQFGQEAKAALDESRDRIAALVGVHSGELFFVSGGTEADNAALQGLAWERKRSSGKDHLITACAEHHAVLETCRALEEAGFGVTYLPVDGYGAVDPDDVKRSITQRTALISVMHANNEVGTINPVAAIGAIAREREIPFHSDAVQTLGKLPFTAEALRADLLSFSAHKIYGPKGIGALTVRKGVALRRMMYGGGQERGWRAGTENVPLAVGFATAAALMASDMEAEQRRLLALKTSFRSLLGEYLPGILFNGHPDASLPHVVNISFDSTKVSIDGEALLFNLDLAGIAVTSGSACTSGTMEPSHVLLAMGRDPLTAKASVRFSFGRGTTEGDLASAASTLRAIVKRIGTPPR